MQKQPLTYDDFLTAFQVFLCGPVIQGHGRDNCPLRKEFSGLDRPLCHRTTEQWLLFFGTMAQ